MGSITESTAGADPWRSDCRLEPKFSFARMKIPWNSLLFLDTIIRLFLALRLMVHFASGYKEARLRELIRAHQLRLALTVEPGTVFQLKYHKRYSRVEYANVQRLAIQSDSGKDGMKEKINGSLNCQEMMRRNKQQR
ncbi:hypothetical protein NC651_038414 [Populus alba x Populus x berolinensis]|nr:hypothetical protein NC651_038414 [Populus alba x Populus x berolinensis]